MKPIKFDLPLNGTRIATLEQLEENLTPEIIEPFRSGKLAKWLRVRDLTEQAEAVEALLKAETEADFERQVLLFKNICKLFVCEVDDGDARKMIEAHKHLPKSIYKEEISEAVTDGSIKQIQEQILIEETKENENKKEKYVINQDYIVALKYIEKNEVKGSLFMSFFQSFFIMENIPFKTFIEAAANYGKTGVANERPLVLYGSANKGLLLTDKSLSVRDDEDEEFSIDLYDISNISVNYNANSEKMIFGVDNQIFHFKVFGSSSSLHFWKAFEAFLKDYLAINS